MNTDGAARSPIYVIGAGPAGLAAAVELGSDCCVIEAEERPGGLVRSHAIEVSGCGRFWFDHVLHLLYFSDPDTERRVLALAGPHLVRCPPVAFVETSWGTARYPLQMHLADLPLEVRLRCLSDLIACHMHDGGPPENFEQALLRTFGRGLCEAFLLPYNRKAWGRPLDTMKGELAWTVTRPDLELVLRGAMHDEAGFTSYNAQGWYPRPPTDAPLRGMEVLSASLAEHVDHLRTATRAVSIDPARGQLRLVAGGVETEEAYRECITTVPLPHLLEIVSGVPSDLLHEARQLRRNRVWSVALCLEGGPEGNTGHWRYYGDEQLSFTRLVFMPAFDPASVPAGCSSIMAEMPEPAESPTTPRAERIARVVEDARRVGAIGQHQRVLASEAWCVDPAYVVFDEQTTQVASAARDWLEARHIHPLGRYGRWEYSSMAQVMRDGFALGARLKLQC